MAKNNKNKSKINPANILNFLFQEERRSGVVLIIAAISAVFLANSMWSDAYFEFIHFHLSLGPVDLNIKHWISEGLMALFFLVVVLEVKREFVDGELSTWRKASFPVVAAIGGMIVPAFIYSVINQSPPQSAGWAIPIATDIAIAIGVLALLGKHIPKNLRIFLLALAIVDDIGSIIVLGVFYSQPTNPIALFVASILILSLFFFRKQEKWMLSFLIIGLCLWYCLLLSGISGTMAGVIVAALVPLTTSRKNAAQLQSSEMIEDILLPITAFIIVPIFVFTSSGIVFEGLSLTEGNGLSVFLGVVAGLVVGKPLGIIGASYIATKLRLTYKPNNLRWSHIIGAGFIAGIGFTISLLVADLSFADNPVLLNDAILGIFAASIISGFTGLVILESTRNK